MKRLALAVYSVALLLITAPFQVQAQTCYSVNAERYKMCGGKGYSTEKPSCAPSTDKQWANCPLTTACQRVNEWYWQCVPSVTGGLQEWQQCSPLTSQCAPGLKCGTQDGKYFMCLYAGVYGCLKNVPPYLCSPPASSTTSLTSSSSSSVTSSTTSTSTSTTLSSATTSSTFTTLSSATTTSSSQTSSSATSASSTSSSSAVPVSTYTSTTPTPTPSPPSSGTPGSTTRYWDCCKVACAWHVNSNVYKPANQCDKTTQAILTGDPQSVQNGGPAVTCSDQTSWVSSTDPKLAYGFAARQDLGGDYGKAVQCGYCYELTFTSTSLATNKKRMIVQVTNLGYDVSANQFDIAMPGGGVGQFPVCCAAQFPGFSGGSAYGGGNTAALACPPFQSDPKLYAGCLFRFDWFETADNPSITFKQVTCPAELIAKSGMYRY